MYANQWLEQAHRGAGWLMALGITEVVLGFLALFSPLAGGLTVVMLIGLALLLGGVIRLLAAFAADSFGSGALAFLWGLVVAATGFYVFTNPGVGLLTLTLVLSLMFFVSGLLSCIVAFQMKPEHGWGWMLAGGIVALLLAILVWRQFPVSGVWLVGTLVGIGLFSNGVTTMMIAREARKLTATE